MTKLAGVVNSGSVTFNHTLVMMGSKVFEQNEQLVQTVWKFGNQEKRIMTAWLTVE